MKIVFVNPTTALRRFPPYRAGGKVYGQPNSITGPLILGGILKKRGHDVSVYEELNGRLDEKDMLSADVVCLYTMTSTAPRAYELADMVHERGKGRVIIGGMHASVLPEEALEHADQVVTGEGEKIIADVIEGRISDRIVKAQPICDLDEVPFPDYSILKTPCVAANILTTRGCPFRCTFCTTSRMFAPYRKRSVENVIEEIRMYKSMGFRYMNFEDDNFTADKERAKEICRRIIAEKLQFKETFFFGRTDMAKDEELLELLSKAHLTRVLIGIESLNQASLDLVDKHQSIDDIEKAAAACKKHGIRLIASIVLGLDTDDSEDIHRTIAFAKSINAYQLQPAVLTPFPGTPVYEQYEREGRMLPIKWDNFDLMDVSFIPKHFTPWELQDEFYYAAIEFYDFKSIKAIREAFGAEYAMRRFGLAVLARLGSWGARFCSLHVPASEYYYLRQHKFVPGESGEKARVVSRRTAPEMPEKERVLLWVRGVTIVTALIRLISRSRKKKTSF